MSQFFLLDSYRGMPIHTCPGCKKERVFQRYVYANNGQAVAHDVGVCSNKSCKYWYHPIDYFKDNKMIPRYKGENKGPSFISKQNFSQSLNKYEQNSFALYMNGLIGADASRTLITKYRIGTSDRWKGASLFWYIDLKNRVRTGKIVGFDVKTGKRDTKCLPFVCWAHDQLKVSDFNPVPCLFGEHLLSENSDKTVVVVQNEANAVLGSHYYADYLWLATGFTSPTTSMCVTLSGRKVIWYPDANFIKLDLKNDIPFSTDDIFDFKTTQIFRLSAA
jgi:hypothetical protein